MKYFSLAVAGLASLLNTSPIDACNDNDLECLCDGHFNQYFDGDNWIDNRCKKVTYWPLDNNMCYNLQYTDYDSSMHLAKTDPYLDQYPAFYNMGYPLTSKLGSIYNVYWTNPQAYGIPCGFSLRNLARIMSRETKETVGDDGIAYIRYLDLRTPLVKHYPVTMFRNTRIADMRLLLQSFTDLPTDFLEDPAKLDLIGLNVRESLITSNQIADSDFFSEYHNLRNVNLQMNELTFLDKNWFKNNNLFALNLSHNEISTIPTDFFEFMPNLELVSFNYNMLTSLDSGSWMFTPNLSMIFLAANDIENITQGDFVDLKKLNRVYLQANTCNASVACKNGNGHIFSNVDFETKRQDFLDWISQQEGADTPAVSEMINAYWDPVTSGRWSRTTLMWARNAVPALTDEKIEEFYNPADTDVGENCFCQN